jgi:hypothetical protein
MKIIDNPFNGDENQAAFENAFADLKSLAGKLPGAENTYQLLKILNFNTSEEDAEKLVTELNRVQYASNTTRFFFFYFPIVSHILYYKPELEKVLLKFIVGPKFADGITETDEMIAILVRTINLKLEESNTYLTKEGKVWMINELPKLEREVEREIQICWKELND